MVKDSQHILTGNSGGELKEYLDNVLLETKTIPPSHGHIRSGNIGDNTTHVLKVTYNCTANGDGLLAVRVLESGSSLLQKVQTFPRSGTFYSLEIIWNPVGGPKGPPTYLEELHKLDNYTKAQYIPWI